MEPNFSIEQMEVLLHMKKDGFLFHIGSDKNDPNHTGEGGLNFYMIYKGCLFNEEGERILNIDDVINYHFPESEYCGCAHDCCGHTFYRSGILVGDTYMSFTRGMTQEQRDRDGHYIVSQSWGINI
jgi:hypothetical protein